MFKWCLGVVIFLIFLFNGAWAAQTAVTTQEVFFTVDLVRIYFLLLLFATILNRLLEYLKLVLAYLNRKWGFLTIPFQKIQNLITQKLDQLGIAYNPETLQTQVRKFVISAIMQFLGFGLGIIIAFGLKLNILQTFNVLPNHQNLGLIVSGLLIGAGVEPVHSFFRIAQEKRKLKKMFKELQQ